MRAKLYRVRFLLLLLFAMSAAKAWAEPAFGVGMRKLTLVDTSRSTKAAAGFAGSPERRIDVIVWYPTAQVGQKVVENAPLAQGADRPLVIYSHGTFGHADNAVHLTEDLARHGYIVAAPNFPLTASTAYTRIKAPEISDVVNQMRDVSFVIDRLLADAFFGPAIDKAKIGATGHSLGGVTSYFASFGAQTRDARIVATAPIGAGDPVQSALSSDMGLAGTGHAAVPVPTLFLSAEKDVFARTTGRPHAAYSRLEAPKYEVMVKGGTHVWFRDGSEQPADNKNPDCLFFERWMPQVKMPGCEERVPLISPARQQEITRTVIRTFFDAYLKGDATARDRLGKLGSQFSEVDLVFEDR